MRRDNAGAGVGAGRRGGERMFLGRTCVRAGLDLVYTDGSALNLPAGFAASRVVIQKERLAFARFRSSNPPALPALADPERDLHPLPGSPY